jgi:hypothetical protein
MKKMHTNTPASALTTACSVISRLLWLRIYRVIWCGIFVSG